MRFSILSLGLFFLPLTFFTLWSKHYIDERRVIEWDDFTVKQLNSHLSQGRSVLVLGLPQSVKGLNKTAQSAFGDPALKKHFRSQKYSALKFEYEPWSPLDKSKLAEMQWINENGGYKEPFLVWVSPRGETKVLKNINGTEQVVDFLVGDDSSLPFSPKSTYLAAGIISLVLLGWFQGKSYGKNATKTVGT